MDTPAIWATILVLVSLLWTYLGLNDKKLLKTPAAALVFSPKRKTPSDVWVDQQAFSEKGAQQDTSFLPPKTGRRYIVVGGSGFLGGWIVEQLLQRGEYPDKIRIVDFQRPTRTDVLQGIADGVDFRQLDVSNFVQVEEAFLAPWPTVDTNTPSSHLPPLTVFHTVSNLRYYERNHRLIHSSAKVNVLGTQNIIRSARSAGASVLVYTSSGSVTLRPVRLWLWPWESEPDHYVQMFNDDDAQGLPEQNTQFFSNYARTKIEAERLVRKADKSPTLSGIGTLRTGIIRPSNSIFGPRGDLCFGAFLVRKTNPLWASSVVQSFTYVENGALAHLCYERRLINLPPRSASPTSPRVNGAMTNPDIGGQSFTICDAGPLQTFGDGFTTLTTLSHGEVTFPQLSTSAMLLFAHFVEIYHHVQQLLLPKILPPLSGSLINVQPSLFTITCVHMIFDDSRARLPPEQGGLGYNPPWTTMDGLHKTFQEHQKGSYNSSNADVAGVSSWFDFSSWFGRKAGRLTQRVEADNADVLTDKSSAVPDN